MNDSRPITLNNDYKVNRLKLLRIQSGLSQLQLSERSGIKLKSIGNYEQGRRDLNHARGYILYRLSQALDCTIEDLLDIDSITQPH